MIIVYAGEQFPRTFAKSIFLAGPTPRSSAVASWRPEATSLLEDAGYDGVVLVPEPKEGHAWSSPVQQMEWEKEGLNLADCILFWIPRDLETLPGFTTNVEWGIWARSGKAVLGAPPAAPNMEYLRWTANDLLVPQAETLKDTVAAALSFIGEGALRRGGERHIPLYIWRLDSFQSWYRAQRHAGNRLDGATVEWAFRVGPKRQHVFLWAIHAKIWIGREKRSKTNEVVIGRPDIACVVIYRRAKNTLDSEVVLIREFRSPTATEDGYIWEVPGGSSHANHSDPAILAIEEVDEETGFGIDPSRIRAHGSRQLAGTLSVHKAHVYSLELTAEEMQWFKSRIGTMHGTGGPATGERTFIEVKAIREILTEELLDWSTVGMILSVVHNNF